jgi:nicotinate phosphoribosyltransferase
VYPDVLLVALTDTFSTKAFFLVHSWQFPFSIYDFHIFSWQEFIRNPALAQHWRGLRQDSGDPFAFAPMAKEVYESLGIDHKEKTILYSDALNLDKSIKLKKQCDKLGFHGA